MAGSGFTWLRTPETLKLSIHVALTAIMGSFAFTLSLPGDTLHSAASFSEFARLGTEGEWVCLFLLAALTGIVGIVAPWRIVRLASTCALATAHLSLAWCFYLGTAQTAGSASTTAVGTYGVVALLGYFLVWVRMFEV